MTIFVLYPENVYIRKLRIYMIHWFLIYIIQENKGFAILFIQIWEKLENKSCSYGAILR